MVKSPEFHSAGLVLGYGYGPEIDAQAPTPSDYIPLTAPGNRLPHRFVDGQAIYDRLGPWYTAIGRKSAVVQPLELAATRNIPIAHLETDDDEIVLVRPDQHIAWVGDDVDDPARILDDALQGFTPHR